MKNILLLFCSLLLCSPLISQTNFKITGGNLKVTDDVDIVLQNTKWTNNANFSATDGAVVLKGDATTSDVQISGNNETVFNDLTINKSANNAELSTNIEVSGQLTLQSGLLDIGDFNLDFGAAGFTIFNGQNYILTSGTGNVIRQIQNGNSANFIVGDGSRTPIIIQNQGASDDFLVRVTTGVLENGISGNLMTSGAVNRTWHIEEANAAGTNLNLTAQWNASDELAGFDRDNCYLAYFEGSWDAPAPGAAIGNDPYQISRSGVNNIAPFTVMSQAVLPVELLSFRAFLEGEKVQLKWETANEINNSHFEIEHSVDGKDFVKIGEVAAKTELSALNAYDFLHKNPKNGSNYYRLRQVDLDGTAEYSDIRWVLLEKDLEVVVYPNPTSGMLFFETKNEIQEVRILDTAGRIVWQSDSSFAGVNLQDLASGIYVCEIHIGEKVWNKRIVKE